MGMEVYANGMSIACKAADGKTIAAFPDVCFTPPLTPATPPGVPIPFPNTAMASDTTDGTKTVKINGQEVMLKNLSVFKTSTGDEAGNAPKKGVVTSQIKGEANFICWSMDVKFEGENVPRHLDLMGHNEQCNPTNTPPWPYLEKMSASKRGLCQDDKDKEEGACNKHVKTKKLKSGKVKVDRAATKGAQCDNKECQKARKCMLTAYRPNQCCSGQTGHHLVEVHSFCEPGKPRGRPLSEFKKYDQNAAPVVCAACAKGSRYDKEHGRLHAYQGTAELDAMNNAKDPSAAWTYKGARQAGVEAHAVTFRKSNCNSACMKAQLDAYHKNQVGVRDNDIVRTATPPLQDWQVKAGRAAVEKARSAAVGVAAGA